MKKAGKELVRGVVEDADLFHQFLVAVIPALKKWFHGRSKAGVREAATELLSKLGEKFEEAREEIEKKHEGEATE